MMFQETISKEALKELPLLTFTGKIHLIENHQQMLEAIRSLQKEKFIGFDTEKKPTFRKGEYHPTALIQLSTDKEAFLFRVNIIGIPLPLKTLFENENILKIGVGIRDDLEDMKRLCPFQPGGFVELIDITRDLGIKNAGVRNLSGIFLKKRVSKNQQTSNWENETLTKAQQLYAAADAWVPQQIYSILDHKGFIYN